MGLARWDVLLSDLELETFFKNVGFVNRAQNHCLVLGVIWHDMGRIRQAMLAHGYLDSHPLFNYKPQQNTSGMAWIQAIECMVVGYKGGVRNCQLVFADPNPVYRHNVLLGHQVGPKRKFTGEDEDVNTTQKNPHIASTIGRITCIPGAWALVLGAGSGSEVVGLARIGVNVVGIERDAKQFRALTERITTEAAYPEDAQKQLADDDARIRLLKQVITKFTKLNPDAASHFTEVDQSQASSAEADSGAIARADAPDAQSVSCVSCGDVVTSQQKFGGCAKHQCAAQLLHVSCMVACGTCGKMFCTSECCGAHGC